MSEAEDSIMMWVEDSKRSRVENSIMSGVKDNYSILRGEKHSRLS